MYTLSKHASMKRAAPIMSSRHMKSVCFCEQSTMSRSTHTHTHTHYSAPQKGI